MDLVEKIGEIIDLLNFTEEEKQQVFSDLILAIGTEVGSELSAEQQEKIKEVVRTKTGAQEAFAQIDPAVYSAAAKKVIESWLVEVLPTLDEAKQQEILTKLETI